MGFKENINEFPIVSLFKEYMKKKYDLKLFTISMMTGVVVFTGIIIIIVAVLQAIFGFVLCYFPEFPAGQKRLSCKCTDKE